MIVMAQILTDEIEVTDVIDDDSDLELEVIADEDAESES